MAQIKQVITVICVDATEYQQMLAKVVEWQSNLDNHPIIVQYKPSQKTVVINWEEITPIA